MIDYNLDSWAPGPFVILVVLVVFSIPVFLIITFLRSILWNKEENIRLRLEVGKLADELEKVRKQKGAEKEDSSEDSG